MEGSETSRHREPEQPDVENPCRVPQFEAARPAANGSHTAEKNGVANGIRTRDFQNHNLVL